MTIKNITNETQIIPHFFIRPIVKNLENGKEHQTYFYNKTGFVILVPGEQEISTFAGSDFFSLYFQFNHIWGFPDGEYQFYSSINPDIFIRFKVNKVLDEKSFSVVKELGEIKYGNTSEMKSSYNRISDEATSISDTISKSIIKGQLKYWELSEAIRNNKMNIDQVKSYLLEFPQFKQSVYLIKNIKRKSGEKSVQEIFYEKFINNLKNDGLRKFIIWQITEIENADYYYSEHKKAMINLHNKMNK